MAKYSSAAERKSSDTNRTDTSSQYGLEVGQLVRSKAGRDNGQYYLIIAFEGYWVVVADGLRRKIANPKKKNQQHLQKCHQVAADLITLIEQGKLTDEVIRENLNKMYKGENAGKGEFQCPNKMLSK